MVLDRIEAYCLTCDELRDFNFKEFKFNNNINLEAFCNKCGSKYHQDILDHNDGVELILRKMEAEDELREKDKYENKRKIIKRKYNKKHKLQKLYKISNQTFTFGGVFLKKDQENGKYFLKRYSYRRKPYQKIANKQLRLNSKFDIDGSSYKRKYSIDRIII